jgi:periplasmic divalent cation tolerance protein
MTDNIVILCTCPNDDEAERIARALLDARLAACVSVLPGARSFYRWKGQVEQAVESLLVIKSSRPLFDALRAAIEKAHSYDVPEIIALPIVDGAPPYLAWLQENLRQENLQENPGPA